MRRLLFYPIVVLFCTACGGGGSSSDSTDEDTGIEDTVEDTITATNTVPALVVLISFADRAIDSSEERWASLVFGTQAAQLNNYFAEVFAQVDGGFGLVPVAETYGTAANGVVAVTVDSNHPSSASASNNDVVGGLRTLLPTVMEKVAGYISAATVQALDADNNGWLHPSEIQVIFVAAGYEGAASTQKYPAVHGHSYFAIDVTLHGIRVLQESRYTMIGEKHFDTQTYDATMGIIAHELGHSLFGVPDLYDSTGNSAGIGVFGLMGGGSWGYAAGQKPGDMPVHPTAYIKTLFFETVPVLQFPITTVTTNGTYTVIAPSETTDSKQAILKIPVQAPFEYFLIEYRKTVGYDTGLTGISNGKVQNGGIAVWHIDESKNDNSDELHKVVDLEEATGNNGLDAKLPDTDAYLFPSIVHTMNDTSAPNTNTYRNFTYQSGTTKHTGIVIDNFAVSGNTASMTITPHK